MDELKTVFFIARLRTAEWAVLLLTKQQLYQLLHLKQSLYKE